MDEEVVVVLFIFWVVISLIIRNLSTSFYSDGPLLHFDCVFLTYLLVADRIARSQLTTSIYSVFNYFVIVSITGQKDN